MWQLKTTTNVPASFVPPQPASYSSSLHLRPFQVSKPFPSLLSYPLVYRKCRRTYLPITCSTPSSDTPTPNTPSSAQPSTSSSKPSISPSPSSRTTPEPPPSKTTMTTKEESSSTTTTVPGTTPPVNMINNTPGFTPRLSTTPMPRSIRQHYINLASESFSRWLDRITKTPNAYNKLGEITLLLPELNPELDVYSRRFVLDLMWGLVHIVINHQMKVCICIQGKDEEMFGGEPLATVGLKKMIQADCFISEEEWNGELKNLIQIREIKKQQQQQQYSNNKNGMDDTFDVYLLLIPTNAINMPIVLYAEQFIKEFCLKKNKIVILLNENLRKMPGPTKIKGLEEAIRFLNHFEQVFYLKPLYKAGTMYPIQGILYKQFPGVFQIWKKHDDQLEKYSLIAELAKEKPGREDIGSAFENYTIAKTTSKTDQGLSPVFSLAALAALLIGTLAFMLLNGGAFPPIPG